VLVSGTRDDGIAIPKEDRILKVSEFRAFPNAFRSLNKLTITLYRLIISPYGTTYCMQTTIS